ncbi:ABC transporter permease [Catenulispora subtropica]|uniref:ABC transporter permease n=1 Tax=Catenulispora subtropica TaxID=450798 RepID=A0ABN2T7T6_9ACTN
MTAYLIRRTLQAIATLFIVSIATFGLLHLMPNGVVRGMLGQKATPDQIAYLTHKLGLDRNLFDQYWIWLKKLVQGDLGFSYQYNQSVDDLIKERLGQSAYLVGLSLLITIVLAVPIGVLQATRRNSITDYTLTTVSFVAYAVPVFFIGVILRQVFQVELHWIPTANQIDSFHAAFTQPVQMILPVGTLVIGLVAGYSRYMRSSMLDELTQDYVRTATAKGATKRRVLYGHVLRNATIPMATLVGLSLPGLVGGALLVEQVFNIQGLGLLTINAAQRNDYVVVLGTTMLTALATVIGSLVADISYAALDPRVRLT